jgi:predicted ABC-type ATPase
VSDAHAPCIYVFAGVNGAGKSSIAGEHLRKLGHEFFNPDEVAQRRLAVDSALSLEEAQSAAWHAMVRMLRRAIGEHGTFAFETTLGGTTIAGLLLEAEERMDVRIWYVGLDTPERHVARVRARVARGGHDVAEDKIRERYLHSRWNLIRLMPGVTELRVYDNSQEADPGRGKRPKPELILHTLHGQVLKCDLRTVPEWARPIAGAALRPPPN